MTLENLYDDLDYYRWQWWIAYEDNNDIKAIYYESIINSLGCQVIMLYGELALVVYYQWG